jgi:DNA polymerase-3 subunit delta'
MSNAWPSIIGHDWAVEILAGAIRHRRVGHAYLITGPAQVGKTTLARIFAQALNCTGEDAERPCRRCRACTLIAADRHPDVRLLEPDVSGRGKLTLKIDEIRDLQQGLSLGTHEARYKVAILKRFDAATDGAANAFLKTLEEPPNNVILLLTAIDADTLLPTITSRCRIISLRPLDISLIRESLQRHWGVTPDQARLLAHLADGRLGWAVQAADDPTLLQERERYLEQLYTVFDSERVGRFVLADRLAGDPETLPKILRNWLSWWRDLSLLAHSTRANDRHHAITNIDQGHSLEQLAQAWTADQIVTGLKQTNQALWQLAHNANARLVLENLFLTYPLKSAHAAPAKNESS